MLKKHIINWLALVGLAFFVSACSEQSKEIVLAGKTMGTTYHIKYLIKQDDKIADEKHIHQGIDEVLAEVNRQMSTYMKDSEISQFNQLRDTQTALSISPEFGHVVKEAIRLNKITDGALDVTVGPLVNLWGFGPEHRPDKAPTQAEIDARRTWTGIEKLHLAEKNGVFNLSKTVPELYLDLSSIAKGFGVDQVADYLDSQGVKNYLVEVGGEIRAKGQNSSGQPWQIAIEKPEFDGSRAVQQIVGLKDMSMATSGDYRNYFEENGVRFSHEIDPTSGQPIQHQLASVTVITPHCMTADGLSTGLFVLGEEKAMALAQKERLAIYMIVKTTQGFEIRMSDAFKQLIKE
ncbi:FAD:protein FMN transferase [Spirabiliibacterium falconis]|uniref:FAD:protein FMN transferase n=1 Tax=Spirabiliibacterium falconis TaxID=572023 RepID=UPI001AAD61D6|nr:FAD:protein FMN transferase [Spirabiliibacterium falconis]MBE2893961.1 FAD:protein FMN transferase [Spirabiliibacterium falconis]